MSEPVASDSGPFDLPRLRIHHLLVWMAVTASLLTLARATLDTPYFQVVYSGLNCFDIIVNALALTVVGFGVVWRYQSKQFPCEPGHGLLFQVCLILGWVVTGQLFHACFIVRDEMGFFSNYDELPRLAMVYLHWNWSFYVAASSMISLICAFWIVNAGRWRTYFLLCAAMSALELISSFLLLWVMETLPYRTYQDWMDWTTEAQTYVPSAATTIVLLSVLFLDYRAGVQRHWTHWTGVFCVIATTLLFVVE